MDRSGSLNHLEDPIPCQQVNDLVRIGPIVEGSLIDTNDQITSTPKVDTIQLAPWAFAALMWDQTVKRLQLDLQLRDHVVTALSLGGLENLEELLARTSYLRWDSCSLAGLTRVRQVLLSCRSEYEEFLTLGPSVEVIRFVDCEEATMQFYCINCIQDPSIHVIRVRPGPPLRQYMIKFSQLNRTTDPSSGTHEQRGRLSIGRCVPNICSDSMLCRDNQELQVVQENAGRPTPTSTVTTSTTTESTTTASINVTTSDTITDGLSSLLPQSQSDATTEPNVSTNLSDESQAPNQTSPASVIRHPYFPPAGGTENTNKLDNENMLTRSQRIWVAASIVSVIAVFLITACVLIGIMRQRSRRQSVKYNRPRPRQTKYSNGLIRDRPDQIDEDENGKLELPERVC
ncbi:unnamed protein product [Echinostoma caproni]|uniref:MANSC domain-containing protein n=1 Tax=Echinostoma caproni TaxID=27848 RepID=A0A183A600_9TREM|nr:unnamed protein product [Echinostoma caproni]